MHTSTQKKPTVPVERYSLVLECDCGIVSHHTSEKGKEKAEHSLSCPWCGETKTAIFPKGRIPDSVIFVSRKSSSGASEDEEENDQAEQASLDADSL